MFFRTFPLFTLFGFRVRLDVGWLLLATLVVITRAQVFTSPPFELEAPGAVALGLFFAFGLLMSIVLHELSHSLVARRHGIQIRGITLFMLGGVSEMESEPERPWSEFLIAIVGPLSSVVIALVIALAAWGAAAASVPAAIVALAWELALLNGMLAVFNLLPAFPLDGGRVLRSILWGLKGDAIWASNVAGRTGQGFGILMLVGGIALVVMGNIGFFTMALIGWFIFKAAPMPHRVLVMKKKLEQASIAPFVDVSPVVVPSDLALSTFLARVSGSDEETLPVSEDGRIVALISLGAARAVPEDSLEFRSVGDVSRELPARAVVSTAMSADEALRRMQELQIPALLVVDAARLIGIIRWQDLLRFAEARA